MNLKIIATLMIILGLSGCINNSPNMQLHDYKEPIISMELNHERTTSFCQAKGYSSAHQWFIGEEHSGMYGRRVGYDLWGMDGSFNANDNRIHVDCEGQQKLQSSNSYVELRTWLNSINYPINKPIINNTYDVFCQQQGMQFESRVNDSIICYKLVDTSMEYTPQEIAKWYLINGK